MINTLKHGIAEATQTEADQQVKATVEAVIADVRVRGDAAVREYSAKFDRWSPDRFRLSADEVQSIIGTLPQQAIDDIRWAQTRIREFALHQRAAIRDIEVETLPGVFWGTKISP